MAVIISDSGNSSYGTSVETFTITNGGSGYVQGEDLTLDGGDSGCTINIDTVNGSGVILTASLLTTGSGYSASVYDGTGGSGAGAQFTVASLYQGFSTTDGFYRVESYNMGLYGISNIGIVTGQFVNITFANACNCLGVVLPLLSVTPNCTRGVNVGLEEYQSVTSFDTGTEKINKVSHGLNNNDKVSFSTTGVLPTGIVSGTQYYVVNKSANDFQVSLTLGGSAIALSGTPSGTWAVGLEKTSKLLTVAEIVGDNSYHRTVNGNLYNAYGSFLIAATFTTPYAVLTTAGLYRIRIMTVAVAGTVGTWFIKPSDGAVSPAYAVWGDNKVSFNNDDIVIVKDKLIIDESLSLGGVLGTGEITCATAAWICSNVTDPTADNVALLEWQNPPISSYTMTVKGRIFLAQFSGIRVGTSTLRIPYSKKAIITYTTQAAGTIPSGIGTIPYTSVAATGMGGSSLFFYGAIPTYQKTNLISDALISQTHLLCTDNVDWVNGDEVVIGKANTAGQGQVGIWTISSVSGNDITLTSNLTTFTQRAGGTVVRLNRHGILIQNDVTTTSAQLACPANLQFSGVDTLNIVIPMSAQTTYNNMASMLLPSLRSQWLIQDCVLRSTGASSAYFMTIPLSPEGALFQRVYTHRVSIVNNVISYFTAFISSGRLTMRDCALMNIYSNGLIPTANSRVSVFNCSFENGRASTNTYFIVFQGIECEFYNNTFWGNATTAANYGAVWIAQIINPIKIENNHYDNNVCGIGFGAYASIKCSDKDATFGSEYANTTDIYIGIGCIPDYIFKNLIEPVGGLVLDTTNIEEMVVGTRIAFTNYNNVPNDDRNIYTTGKIQRTGLGLSDETLHTSAVGKYAVRFESTSTSGDIEFSQDVPTGDILGSIMAVTAWVKINNANFYSGSTYTNPTLTIVYDDGTSASVSAVNTTDWQLLTISFNPITSSGKIVLSIGGNTNATGTDAYFYLDDISVFYPPGIVLNLGGLDLWADALPITPSISTGLNATDVWAVQSNVLTDVGSVGKLVVDNLDAKVSEVGTTPPTVEEIRAEMDSNSTQLIDIKAKTDFIPTVEEIRSEMDDNSVELAKIDTIISDLSDIDLAIIIIGKLTGNKVTKSGDIVTIYEDNGVDVWKQYNLASGGRVEV